MRDALTSKNIHLARKNYVVSSKHDILKVAGIECFEDNRANVQRLIVVEATEELNSEVVRVPFVFSTSIFTRDYFQDVLLEKMQKSKGNYSVHPTDDFDYRSIVLWLSLGCVGVFVSLQMLRCLLKKSEKKSEEYRLSQHNHEALSTIDDTKGNSIVSND